MKKILFYILACTLLMSACNLKSEFSQQNDDEQKTTDSTQTDQQSSDSLDKGKDMTGQLYVKMIDLTASVKEVRSQVDSTKTQINELNKVFEAKVDQMQFNMLLGGMILLFIVIIFIVIIKLQKHQRHVDQKIERLKGHLNQLPENQKYAQPSSSVSRRDIDALNKEINNIYSRLRTVEDTLGQKLSVASLGVQQSQWNQQQVSQIHQSKEDRKIRFGVNTKNIFPNALDAGDVHIAFEGVYKSDNEVEFEPIGWERIKSFNELSDVVTVKGNREGSIMHIDRKGRAKKQIQVGRVYWEVTLPAIITIS